MSIQNLQSIIKAREVQQGHAMVEEPRQEGQSQNDETTEILRLMFAYLKKTFGEINVNIAQMNQEINIIKIQQQKILGTQTKDN